MPPSSISLRTRLAYSIGHFQNDLMASMWFSYLLIYLHQVRDFNNIYAGTLLLVGQIADAIATPLIGYEADATSGFCGYSKRKSWHLFGSLCTTLSFPFLFSPVLGATNSTHDYALFVYYSAFVIIFQIGWASVQISHLSLIPELTSDESETAGLNGWRYAATGVANLTTYAVAWGILSSGGNVNSDSLNAGDADNFRNLGFIVTGLGLVSTTLFHIGVREPKPETLQNTPAAKGYGTIGPNDPEALANTIEQSIINRSRKRRVGDWLCDSKFYQVAVMYMSTRLYVNISQVYLPMYLTETIHLSKTTIANVPLVCFASSFITATALKMVDKRLGRVLTYFCGLVFALGASVFVYFIHAHVVWMVYAAAVMIGIGGALMLGTSLSFVADLIGDFTGSSAFVYGAMSFTDKLSNGCAVEIIQVLHPCVNCCPACEPYYRRVQSFVPGGAAVMALFSLITLALWSVSNRSKSPEVMYNCSAVENRALNSGSAAVDEDGDSRMLPSNVSPSLMCTIAEVYPSDPDRSLNDGRKLMKDDDGDDSEDEPLLTNRKFCRSAENGLHVG